jgi:hypothetical protein
MSYNSTASYAQHFFIDALQFGSTKKNQDLILKETYGYQKKTSCLEKD